MNRGDLLFELRGVCKSFSGIAILREIDFAVYSGEVHVILGENGAGKSTLMKVLTGAYQKDSGSMWWQGQPVDIDSPNDATKRGISVIYQELNLVSELTVYENIFLGREIRKVRSLFLDIDEMRARAAEYMNLLGISISPDALISSLGMGQKQLVEIAKALSVNAKCIIMDEPTSSLSGVEAENLLLTLSELRQRGISIIYISHKLEELRRIGDRISILREGRIVATRDMRDICNEEMVQLMIGRKIGSKYPKEDFEVGQEGLRVENLKVKGSFHEVCFSAYQGQILGIAGIVGAGRTEMVRGIFGADPVDSGDVYVFGEKVSIRSPRDALKAGLALISENRREEGLVLDQSIEFNLSLPSLDDSFFLRSEELKMNAQKDIKELRIYPIDLEGCVAELSGGNQQKIVIGKWIGTSARVYLFDEPTRGIDVGAKIEIYHVLNELVRKGAIVVIVSSELPEIMGICDRILVMRDGAIIADWLCGEVTQEMIMTAATGESICQEWC